MEILEYVKSNTLNDLLNELDFMKEEFDEKKYSDFIDTNVSLIDAISIIIMHNDNPNYGFLPITITDINTVTNADGNIVSIIDTKEYGSMPGEYSEEINYKEAGNYIVCNKNKYKIISVYPNTEENINNVFAEEVLVDFNINTLDDLGKSLLICINNMINSYLNEDEKTE